MIASASIVALLKWEDLTDVILVGHSYGGMVITGVADRALERIAQLVYLDAAHPVNGESLADVAPASISAAQPTLRRSNGVEVAGSPQFDDQHFGSAAVLPPYGESPAEMEAWSRSHTTPVPWRALTQKLRLEREDAVNAIPRTNINTSSSARMGAQSEAAQRKLKADRVWTVDTTHNLMLTEPKITSEMLLRLAAL